MALTWMDNFTGPAGAPPDPAFWTATTNQAGGGNQEAQYYTPQNAALTGSGGLALRATADTGTYQGWNGPSTILSGKVWTKEKLAWRYGYLEVTVADFSAVTVPGAWPAVWLLGQNFDHVGWPECSELDVMEWFGQNNTPNVVSGALHTLTDNIAEPYTMPLANTPPGKPHTFTLDWRPTSLSWGVDGVNFLTVTKAQLKSWPFDLPMFLILNLAIGGTMGGPVPAASALPMTMTVQSVALYNAEIM